MMDAPNYAIAISSLKLTGKIEKDDEETWGRLTRSFVNSWVTPKGLAEAICEGRAYTSWHDPEYRHHDNWQLSQYLAVDLDTCDARSALPIVSGNDFVMAFATLLHTTPSHTEEKPRSRIVFALNEPFVDPVAYNAAAKFLSLLLGGDPVSTDCSRFFYGNAHAKVELLGGHLPIKYLRTLYQRYQSYLEREKVAQEDDRSSRSKTSNYGNNSTMGKHRQPTPNGQRHGRCEDVEKLLKSIDPWAIDYKEWVACVGAIKHELGDAGLTLAISWGQGKKGEVERMWRSMRREQGIVATFGTLVHLAYPQRH